MAMEMAHEDLRLMSYWHEMGEIERYILLDLARALCEGQRVYGRFKSEEDEERDMELEGLEEVRDGLVYLTRKLVARYQARRELGDD